MKIYINVHVLCMSTIAEGHEQYTWKIVEKQKRLRLRKIEKNFSENTHKIISLYTINKFVYIFYVVVFGKIDIQYIYIIIFQLLH